MNILYFLLWVVLVQQHVSSEIRLEVTSHTNPVTVGGIVTFQCKIWNLQDTQTVLISRTLDGGKVDLLSLGDQVLDERANLATRLFANDNGGSVIYFLTKMDAALVDRGKYTCKVTSLSLEHIFSSDSLDIDVFAFPDASNPTCTSTPEQVLLQGKSGIELTCSSEKGSPSVQLKWTGSSFSDHLLEANITKGDHVYTQLFLPTQIKFRNAIFICEMTSPGFPDHKRSCQIGPITIIPSDNQNGYNGGLVTDASNTENSQGNKKDPNIRNPLFSSDCNDFCRSKYYNILYLIIFTMVMGLLSLVFFGTTIVMCCKLCKHSTEARDRQRFSGRNSYPRAREPVYVSLQRHSDNERVYMTLEDPNSPQDRVVCRPRDAYEQYINSKTLSLRRI